MDVIKVSKRDFSIKAKHLRDAGMVPGSVYGGPLAESISLQIDEPAARRLVNTKLEGSRLTLELDGKQIPVQLKEKAVNMLSNQIQHINFQALKADQKVNTVLHILVENGEKVAGTLEKMLLEIPYAALPADMIDTITIDVDGMPLDTVITVADIPELNTGKLELQVNTDEIVLRIMEKKIIEEPAEEEAEAAEEA